MEIQRNIQEKRKYILQTVAFAPRSASGAKASFAVEIVINILDA
jgi:hypothetical protein